MKGGKPYTGYASAPSDLKLKPEEIISRRYGGNFDEFGGRAPTPVYNGSGVEGKNTARGLEQHHYEEDVKKHGKYDKNSTKGVANKQNPVGPNNGKIDNYTDAKNKHLKKYH
ncbi:hypothetical protein KLA_15670 [Cellulophaga geojensis KL-A]|uniref:Uncharacterized protein n=1 Tax=Cellulophaga geojensis KL-A TaxID=1328323 RepID=A0ABN0RK84_9FLAO|nr:hypothetical protein [Cellulophaga geojensis]EWH11449.1 hypothetical protein KLA_15670 [Cellulophaga geojensis KL-A]